MISIPISEDGFIDSMNVTIRRERKKTLVYNNNPFGVVVYLLKNGSTTTRAIEVDCCEKVSCYDVDFNSVLILFNKPTEYIGDWMSVEHMQEEIES